MQCRKIKDLCDTPDLRDKVDLEYLRIEDKGTQAINLQSEQLHNGGANAGIAKEEEEERLSVLIEHLNEVFGTECDAAALSLTWSGQGAPANLTVKTLTAGQGAEMTPASHVVSNYAGWR